MDSPWWTLTCHHMDQVVLHVLQVGDVGKVSNKIRPKKKKNLLNGKGKD